MTDQPIHRRSMQTTRSTAAQTAARLLGGMPAAEQVAGFPTPARKRLLCVMVPGALPAAGCCLCSPAGAASCLLSRGVTALPAALMLYCTGAQSMRNLLHRDVPYLRCGLGVCSTHTKTSPQVQHIMVQQVACCMRHCSTTCCNCVPAVHSIQALLRANPHSEQRRHTSGCTPHSPHSPLHASHVRVCPCVCAGC